MCVLTYSDPPRAKEIARIIAQSNEGGTTERACCVFFESSEEEKGKRPNNRDPLFAQKLCFFGEKVRHPILPFYPHFYAHINSLSFSLCHHELLLAKRLGVVRVVGWWLLPSRKRCRE